MSRITGKAKRYDGSPVDYIAIFDWSDGSCVSQVKPNPATGGWAHPYASNMTVGITYVADGCEPITHGPYVLATNWSPLNLFTGQQGCWYDPSDLSTLFQDTSGSVPVTASGQEVALMRDKSGNNNHMVQSNVNAKPIYRSVGGRSWLEFDGVDDFMELPTRRFSTPAYLSVAVELINNVAPGAFSAIFGAGYLAPETGFGYYISTGEGISGLQVRIGSSAISNKLLQPQGVHVATSQIGSQSLYLAIDNKRSATLDHSLGVLRTTPSLAIGARGATDGSYNHYSNVKFYGGVLSEGSISAENQEYLLDYLAAKSGATLQGS